MGLFTIVTAIIFVGIPVVILLWGVGIYNALVQLRQQVKNAWSQIDVQLKRRHDLIPNLVETAKGYMKHERETLEAVIKARQVAVDADSIKAQAEAENMLTQTLSRLMMLTENYPDLKANQNMMAIQEELTTTENKISFARQFYNDSAMKFNTKIQVFPNNVVAGMFKFENADFFEIEEPAQREAPKVEF